MRPHPAEQTPPALDHAHILNFTRADASALTLTPADVRVADVLRDAVDTLGPQFQAKGVRLLVEAVPAAAILHGDCEKVLQIVLNLLSNALKFTARAGEVVLAVPLEAEMVWLEVRDAGIGIAPDRLDDIFEPFVRVDGSLTHRAVGTGLGPAIARMLATAMGGCVEVVSLARRGRCSHSSSPAASRQSAAVALPGGVPARAHHW